MTSIASHVILHPKSTQFVKLLSSTVGRDKIYRLIQNFARFYAWYLLRHDHKDAAARWGALKSSFGLGRKMMRLGKPLEHLQAALKAVSSHQDGALGEQLLAIGRQLAYAAYLTNDGFVWAEKVKFLHLTPQVSKQIAHNANRFWLIGIACNLIAALLKSGRLANEVRLLKSPSNSEKDLGSHAERHAKIRSLEAARSATRYQFIIDALDIWSPASNLDMVDLNDGVLGVMGTITSAMSVKKQWESAAKK